MASSNIDIDRGRTGTIVLSVDDLPESEELRTKLYATSVMGNPPCIILDGVISSDHEDITFTYDCDDTKNIRERNLYYEVVVYLEDRSFIKNVVNGLLRIVDTVKIDPTI